VGRRRSANEDRYAACPDRGLYVVADGMGGHRAGSVAADVGVNTFLSRVPAGSPSRDPLRDAIRAANSAVRAGAEEDPDLKGMGTTVAALWTSSTVALVAHVGDSRVYLLRDEMLYPLTRDHSVVSILIRRGKITAAQARHHPNRNVVTRALGVSPTVEPDIREVRVSPNDRFLLCTDGISGVLTDAEIHRLLMQYGGRLDRAADSLIDAANARGGRDNATVLITAITG
jgi:protein phosphatase